jgi:hypothetical protein
VGGDSDGTTLGDTIADEKTDVDDTVLGKIDIESLERYGLACLDARELFVIARRFGLGTEPPQHLLAIGEILGLSREAVRQIEVKALAKMQQGIKWMAVSPPGNTLGGNRRCASTTGWAARHSYRARSVGPSASYLEPTGVLVDAAGATTATTGSQFRAPQPP